MLLHLLCALQIATAAQAPAVLTIRVGDRVKTVPVVAQRGSGESVRADLLAEALGGQLIAAPGGKFKLTLDEKFINLEAGVAWARTDSTELPMVAAPFRYDNRLYVPLSLATELLPRVFGGLIYDADKDELRRFAIVRAAHGSDNATSKASTQPGKQLPAPRSPAPPFGAIASRADANANVFTPPGTRRRVVIVDAGHGGPDNGMTGPIGATRKVREKDITLAVALELQKQLEARGISVVMTRTTDTLIALGDRGKIANLAKGDLFISVHVNAANPSWNKPATARGFETYFLAEAKTEDEKRVEEMENQSIKFETKAETSSNDPLGFIIRDMAQNEHLRESSTLASLVQDRLKAMHPAPSRGVKQAGFSVLMHSFMPAVLVEVGFGSNPAESAYLTDRAHQTELASAIADAAVSFLQQYERKVGTGTP